MRGLGWRSGVVVIAAWIPVPTALAADDVLCEGREPCQVLARYPAGKDASGAELTVVDVGRFEGAVVPGADPQNCQQHEWWLLRAAAGAPVERGWMFSLCNDGYGASGVGEDEVTVGENHLQLRMSGGSAWRWSKSLEYQLWPFLLQRSADASSFMASERSSSAWEPLAFSGRTTEWNPICGQSSEVEEPELLESEYLPIPSVAIDAAFDWKTHGLGTCGATVDAAGTTGFVGWGPVSTAEDARMRLFIAANALYVEVADDQPATPPPGKTWVADDHLELWWSADFYECASPKTKGEQFAVLRDGSVIAAKASKTPVPTAEVVAGPGGWRWKITLPPAFLEGRLTVVYSDADAAAGQERLIATSPVDRGRVVTLGKVRRAEQSDPSCAVENGALHVVSPQVLWGAEEAWSSAY